MRILVGVLLISSVSSVSLAATVGSTQSSILRSAASTNQQTVDKRTVIDRLKKLKEKQLSETQSLEAAIRKRLQESTTVGLGGESLPIADQRANQMTAQILDLSKKKEEATARREIIDRMIFMVDTKYSTQPFKSFLEQQFLEMANKDLSDGRDGRLWKTLTYLSICVREVPEPREDILDVVEGYLDYSSVLNPKTPADFLASRNYTNGAQSETASTTSKEEAADDLKEPAIKPPTQIITTAAPTDPGGTQSGVTTPPAPTETAKAPQSTN
ncbi:MAG TPA: hypothetical protein VM432_04460 [Bdellovibrionales bacterium]|nr:hypothetical protein [Bdellovibrionales bacterium]